MGFLKKLFRRKKTSVDEGAASKNKKGKKTKTKDVALLKNANPARAKAAAPVAQNAVFRQGSFSNTSITGRGSDSSREKKAEARDASFPKSQVPQTRILSPRNNLQNASSMPPMDKMKLQISPTHHDENRDHSNSAFPPHLSQQQLQQFERQQTSLSPSQYASESRPTYAMSAELPQQQISAMDDMNRSDASSSSFNLSTDAEDSEYEMFRRRGVLPGMNTSTLDTSNLSGVSSPTAYTTDDERIFPALQTDDDMTQATAPSLKEPSVSKPHNMLVPLSTPDDEPGHIQIFQMNDETADDLRAWTFSPSTQASNNPGSNRSGASNSRFTFQGTDPNKLIPTPKNLAAAPASTTSRNTHGATRNFTSPKSQASSSTDFSNNEFGNFADFSNFPTTTDSKPWKEAKSKPNPSVRDFGKDFDNFDANIAHGQMTSSTPISQPDSSLSELLAQAKNKRRSSRGIRTSGRPSSSSVNSAPAITASYLRQQHGLHRYSKGGYGDRSERDGSRTSSHDGTSVSDIIQNLEDTNQSRMKSSAGKNIYSHRSVGDTGAVSTARAVKERLREKRRSDRDYNGLHKSRSSENSSSDNSENEAEESWLFDEVTGALGPRGIAADLESLSGRSNRSKSSQGNKSHKSHRSRSRRSRHSSSRRHKSSNESVDSRGSRTSRNSRNSRYSHRSTKSFLSQMSEQSRSVANDLLRLEMQLAMVGSQENRDDVPVRGNSSVSGTSIGGASRTSRTSRKSLTSHRTHSSSIARRSKLTVVAPPGKLGIILANKADSKGTVVSGVRTSSVLAEKISPGDRIIAIDGEDVSRMTVSEITTIMSRKSDYERTLAILTTPKNLSLSSEPTSQSMTHRSSPMKASGADHFDNSFQHYRR